MADYYIEILFILSMLIDRIIYETKIRLDENRIDFGER